MMIEEMSLKRRETFDGTAFVLDFIPIGAMYKIYFDDMHVSEWLNNGIVTWRITVKVENEKGQRGYMPLELFIESRE